MRSTLNPVASAQGLVTIEDCNASASLTPWHDSFEWVSGGRMSPGMGNGAIGAKVDGKVPRRAYLRSGHREHQELLRNLEHFSCQ